ncbi:MAG: hypothetical protein DI571_10655 [Arsenicicoccus sp.]|uniref:hypothetical protein n=1 Tax=Serinicoccus profundi TaxID=1078471 RepID=UPI000DB494D7|nr:hypothetical protein [Serinicoccus profundi]PZU42844.1 MAG: hypothetical protein DI571_10655 [Arsenicicoccus sp.]
MNTLHLMLARAQATEREHDLRRRLSQRRREPTTGAPTVAAHRAGSSRPWAVLRGRLARAPH